MPDADFSGRKIVTVRRNNGFKPVGRAGSHVELRYEHLRAIDGS